MHIYILLTGLTFFIVYFFEKKFLINDIKRKVYFSNFYKSKYMMFTLLFSILSFFTFFRDGLGVDYTSYIYNIEKIGQGYSNYMEIGFQIMAKVLMFLTNDPKYVIGIAGIITIFFFLKAIFQQSYDIKMSVFIFLTWGYYFYTYNSIRYYLALSISLYAIKFLIDKKNQYFIIYIIMASLFHKSALVCIPLYLLATIKFKKRGYIAIIILAVLMWIFKDVIREVIFLIYPSYEGSIYDTNKISGLNILKGISVVILGGFTYAKLSDKPGFLIYFNLNIFALLLYVFLFWIPETSRIGFYLNITSIIFIPNVLSNFTEKQKKIFSLLIYGLSFLLFIILMIGFYKTTIRLLPYRTWLM